MTWIKAIGPDSAVAELFSKTLELSELSVDSFDQARSCTYGVIVLTSPCDEMIDEILSFMADLDTQILVVAAAQNCKNRDCWRLLDAGARDVIVAPDLASGARHAAARLVRWHENDKLLAQLQHSLGLIGQSPCWRQALSDLVNAARSSDAPILLCGESGTGKELAARLAFEVITQQENRPFAILDCTTIVPTLSGSELFGHERGSFTGATAAHEGAFQRADGGVLFLDEIGELPLELQAQLLRVIQEGRYRRVGGASWRGTNFRLISASNRDLVAEVQAGRFRLDLYFRLAGSVITLPALSERPEDILPLAYAFFKEANGGAQEMQLSDAVRSYLLQRAYPGNVRDLKQLCLSIANTHPGSTLISAGDIPPGSRPHPQQSGSGTEDLRRAARKAVSFGHGLNEIKEIAADAAISAATVEAEGNLAQAAAALQVTARALQIRRKKKGP